MAGPLLRRGLRWIERTLFLAGVVGLSVVYLTWREAVFYRSRVEDQLHDMTAVRELPGDAGRPAAGVPAGPADPLLGQLAIPRLALSVPILEGDDDRTLQIASGHLPETPLPWDAGNAAIAGHRDTLFRPLKDVRVGDEIQLLTRHGAFRYRVRQLLIVDPDAVWILGPWDHVDLTLVTCYPFSYIGSAPQRFVVQAERIRSGATKAVLVGRLEAPLRAW